MKGSSSKDVLKEDKLIKGQKYFLFSYFLTGDIESPAMFKMRGAFDNIKDAEKMIKEIQKNDNNEYDIFICETGKWGALFNDNKLFDHLIDNEGIKISYAEQKMNKLMNDRIKNVREKREFDKDRKDMLTKKPEDLEEERKLLLLEKEQNEKYLLHLNNTLDKLKKQPESKLIKTKIKQTEEDIEITIEQNQQIEIKLK